MKKPAVKTFFSPLIHQNLAFLNHVRASKRSRKAIHSLLAGAHPSELLCFVEICLNLLRGRLPLRKRWLRCLQAQANCIRHLARARCARTARHLLLSDVKRRGRGGDAQTGAGLPALAGMLASILVPIIAEKIFDKKNINIQCV